MLNTQIAQILDTILTTWTEDRYATGAFARTAAGTDCGAHSPQAVSWCLQGILIHATATVADEVLDAVFSHVERSCMALHEEVGSLTCINDDYGYLAARGVLVHARASLEALY